MNQAANESRLAWQGLAQAVGLYFVMARCTVSAVLFPLVVAQKNGRDESVRSSLLQQMESDE